MPIWLPHTDPEALIDAFVTVLKIMFVEMIHFFIFIFFVNDKKFIKKLEQ